MVDHVSFDVPNGALRHIGTIVSRMAKIHRQNGNRLTRADRLSMRMDLCATHANGCPLDFAKLAAFDDFNLMHDVFGIAKHIDRSTGSLTGFFLPRCSLPVAEAA